MAWTSRAEPNAEKYISNSYRLEVDGVPLGDYDEITIPEQEWSVIEHRESLGPQKKNTTAAVLQPMDIAFKKHLRVGNEVDLDELEDWFKAGSSDKRGGSIIFFGKEGEEIRRWNFDDGFLFKFKRPDGQPNEDNPVEFTMTLRVSDLERA